MPKLERKPKQTTYGKVVPVNAQQPPYSSSNIYASYIATIQQAAQQRFHFRDLKF